MNSLTVSISASLHDPQGNLIRQFKPKPAHSFLAQFIELLSINMSTIIAYVTKTNGEEYDKAAAPTNLLVDSDASDLTFGLLIGSGTDDVTIDDYVLQAPITTDLTVSAHTYALSYPTANTRRFSISRTFTNGSVSPMPIEEVALYSRPSAGLFFCIDRTLYSVSIPASSSLTLTYRINVSV